MTTTATTTVIDAPMLESEQERLLDEALKAVRRESFEMRRALDRDIPIEAFKRASTMLAELKTSMLMPKFYYKLYVDITDELKHLSVYLAEEDSVLQRFTEYYEIVQFVNNIIPRLYLMITVGTIYFKINGAPKKEILSDLVEMCRGVQHPMRGLFLRNYLLICTRDLLPDTPAGDESNEAGDIRDAIEFIMLNFSEMNKLWVRMQHQGPSRDRQRREQERHQLRILVGTNLVRLSQLKELTFDMYRELVLPGILEQAVSCREVISQEYLMECIIKVFPDEYHLQTLNEILEGCAELIPEVQIKNILNELIRNLTDYATAKDSPGIPADVNLFSIFSQHANAVIGQRSAILPEDVISIQTSLLSLAVKCYQDRSDFADLVLSTTNELLTTKSLSSISPHSAVGRELIKFIKLPVQERPNILDLLEIANFSTLIRALNYRGQALVCNFIIERIIETDTHLSEEAHVVGVLGWVEPFVVGPASTSGYENGGDGLEEIEKTEEFKDEQEMVAKLVHAIHATQPRAQFQLLQTARKILGQGGNARLKITLPALVFAAYKLAKQCKSSEELEDRDAFMRQIFVFTMKTINALKSESDWAPLRLKLFLEGAELADQAAFDDSATVTYEFVSKAISIYEEEIGDNREQVLDLQVITATVARFRQLGADSLDPLTSKCAALSTKLLKKQDQAWAVCRVAHLFWDLRVAGNPEPVRDHKYVGECLKKALKIASSVMEDAVQISLYGYILNENLYFYEQGCTGVNVDDVNALIDKIKHSSFMLESAGEAEPLEELLNRTKAYIVAKQQQPEGEASLYARLQGIKI